MSRLCCEIVKNSRVCFGANILNARSLDNGSRRSVTESSANKSKEYDVLVVGGGIVGVATAREFKERHPTVKMCIVEKENGLAQHQTGHNSGVIHAGIYYKPGSLKAKLCVEGMKLLYKYCDQKGIPYKKVGKLIVATNPEQVKLLHGLKERGDQNNVPDILLLKGEKEIKKYEPNIVGLEAILSPITGIIDYKKVCESYAKDFKGNGGEIDFNFEVNGFKESGSADYPVLVTSKSGKSVKSKFVLTCGGLQSDMLANLSGCPRAPRIVPFRGEYLLLNPAKCKMVKRNIYPVPDPRFPFLGVHITPRMDGSIWLGPNAVLAFKREGYKMTDINLSELFDTLTYPGFIKMALKYAVAGAYEYTKSIITPLQVRELQNFMPAITNADVKTGPAGVRAQALDMDGNLVDDFYFDMKKGKGTGAVGDRVLHCRNAPSPGATSSLAIGKMMADKLEQVFIFK